MIRVVFDENGRHEIEMSASEIANQLAFLAEVARIQRDGELRRSDWTQMPDCTIPNKAAWATYRQALRDIPSQATFPEPIEWPTPPL